MSQKAAFDDANIPVLTEVVQDKASAAPAPPEPESVATASPVEPDWSELERRITEKLSAELQTTIEAAVARAVAQAVEQLRNNR